MQDGSVSDWHMSEFETRRFDPSDRDWLLEQHIIHYARDEGFDDNFGAMVGRILDDFIANHDPEIERGWIVENGTGRLGSVFCTREDETTARLRMLFLMPQARGMGLGRHLLGLCVAHARDMGYAQIVLWTHESHKAACALYRANGWQLMDSKPAHSFGQDVVEQNWQLPL